MTALNMNMLPLDANATPNPESQRLEDDDGFVSDEDAEDFHLLEKAPQPVLKLYTTKQLHELIHDGSIDLNPTWQRDVVWSDAKQVLLIDSIYRNFYVPSIVLVRVLDDDGVPVWVCMDGKQRLTSIQRFFDGQIYYKDPYTKRRWYYTTPSPAKQEVPQRYKDIFASKTVLVSHYETALTEALILEMFQRVQLGTPLSTAERLQALNSDWANWIRTLSQRFIHVMGGLNEHLDLDLRRGRDFSSLAQFVYVCDKRDLEPFPQYKKVETWLQSEISGIEFQNKIKRVLQRFYQMAKEKEYDAAFNEVPHRVAPAEFVFIGVLLFDTLDAPLEECAIAAKNLRLSIRKVYGDIRMRQDICGTLWDFVHKLKNQPRRMCYTQVTKGPKPKRKKRDADEDTEDEDFRPNARSNPTKGKRKQH